jgi:hypothetical protein
MLYILFILGFAYGIVGITVMSPTIERTHRLLLEVFKGNVPFWMRVIHIFDAVVSIVTWPVSYPLERLAMAKYDSLRRELEGAYDDDETGEFRCDDPDCTICASNVWGEEDEDPCYSDEGCSDCDCDRTHIRQPEECPIVWDDGEEPDLDDEPGPREVDGISNVKPEGDK